MMDEATYKRLVSAPIAERPAKTHNVNPKVATPKGVADPSDVYESLYPFWQKSRAVCTGEAAVKAYDEYIDVTDFTNLLIPFSPSMSQRQYNFYKAEAELPGITAQFSKTLVGGLLRKQPSLAFPDSVDEEAKKWIIHEFGKDDSSLTSFMDEALYEEVQTSGAWVFVDYPAVDEDDDEVDQTKIKPYPVLQCAEAIINARTHTDDTGKTILDRVIVKGSEEVYDDGEYEFHPKHVGTVWVHELNSAGKYQVRKFHEVTTNEWNLVATTKVLIRGEEIDMIPAWPLNGSIKAEMPLLLPIIDKEIALYNKLSRRNHLMYGAATYTPVISSSMSDEQFEQAVESGLGSWIHLPNSEDKADILKTPTEALKDMESTIAAGYEEIAKLGVRMLAPETGDQSGVALELRNAAQTAQMGSLNTKVSNTLRQIIAFMVNWYYDLELVPAEIDFELSSDFNPMPQGADWLRLATEWYQQGLIPRSVWLLILKQNDMLAPDYDDKEGQKEINADETIVTAREQHDANQDNFAEGLKAKMNGGPPKGKDK